MASKQLIQLTIILFLIIFPLLSAMQIPSSDDEVDDDDEEAYILDDSQFSNSRLTSKFLGNTIKKIKKGARCDAKSYNICNGVSANNGTSILHCCKKHCRNVLGDRNNCSQCGHKCRLDQRCCGGVCTNVVHNKSHCGKCFKKCPQGVRCEYGYCGYA
ncbi:hypothetical protein LIER_17905 [Lithospermum erythrorhizon]|uniref:Uncharacterized protein n=1 Tax=Lithospermum erythrorhizon TaxID=34254 RepID=A0AAV3QC57_LITER